MEGGDDLFEGGEAAIACRGRAFEGAQALDGTVALAAGLAELLAQPLVLAASLDEGTHEHGRGKRGGGLGVLGGSARVEVEEIGLVGVELIEGCLEALDVLAELADVTLGAGIGAGGLRAERRGKACGERGGGAFGGGCGFVVAAREGDGGSRRGCGIASGGWWGFAQREFHRRPGVVTWFSRNIRPAGAFPQGVRGR